MSYAQVTAQYITAWCRATFKENPDSMGSRTAIGGMIDAFDHAGYASHACIPADRLTADLGTACARGGGVYGAWIMRDKSMLLLTCHGELAWWSGKDGEAAQWPGLRAPENKID